jgi:hypothetical protein
VRARSAVLCAQSELWITKLSWVQLNSGSVHLTRGRTTALASLTMPACESKRRPGRTWRRPNQRSQSASLRSAVGAGRRSCERAWASKGTLRGAPGLLGQPARRQRLRRAQKRRRQRGRRQRRLSRNRQAGARASCSSRKTALSVIVRKRPAPCRTLRGPSNRCPFPSLTWSVRPRRWKNRNPRKVPTCLNRTPTLRFHRDPR